jgi:putative IMPACT (imprinted ancient) family translation regulator
MYAWRAGTQAGQSDGGEGDSGDRLARLIAHANSDVVVIVWRWYGGVKLGPDRWKRISEAAKEALDHGAFLAKSEQEKTTKTKNKK